MDKPIKRPLIKWTSNEWDKLAIALHLEYPEKNFHIADKIFLGVAPFMATMRKTLEESIWRVFHTGNDYKPFLLKAYERLRPTLIKHTEQLEVIKQTHELPESTSVSNSVSNVDSDTDNDNRPRDMPNETKQSRIFWKPDEWLQVARELHRINPQNLHSDTLVGVKLPDLQLAQKVLPAERHRHSLVNMAQSREKLLESFKIIKEEIKALEADRKAQEESDAEAARLAARNPFEVAMQPLVALITAEVMKALMPRIQALAGSIQQPEAALEAFQKAPVSARARKPKVAVVGALPVQQAAIALEFPEIEFVMPDKEAKNTPSQVHDCDRVIAMVNFMSHDQRHSLKNKFKDRFSEVSGGTSSIKRLISVLLASGGIPKPAGQSLHH